MNAGADGAAETNGALGNFTTRVEVDGRLAVPEGDARAISPVIVFSTVDRAGPGGVQGVLDDLSRGLRRRGARLVEVTSGDCGVEGAESCALYLRNGRRELHMPSLSRLGGLLARHRPKVVNVHFVGAETVYFLLLRKLFGYALVLTVHGSDLLRPEPAAARRLQKLLREADAVTAVSADIRDRVRETDGVDPTKVRLIANGVDCRFWSSAEAGHSAASRRIVAVGRLEPIKGFDVLIEAAARLRAADVGFDLEIVGEGSQRERLAGLVVEHGLEEQVSFPGALPRTEVCDRLQSADLFVLSSLSEGMPLALLEAMACGLPAVASDVGGVGEVLPRDAGRLVPAGSPQAMADAISAVFADPTALAKAGRQARRRAEEFSIERKADEYIAAYATALQRRAAARLPMRRNGSG